MAKHQSKQIDTLAAALAKAQGQCKGIQKTGRNPHLKNDYATLDDIINGVRKPLADNGLAWTQLLGGKNGHITLTTILMHESGQWLKSTVAVAESAGNRGVNAVQALGSSITYMKRYALSAMLGIASEVDDDGNGAPEQQRRPQKPKPERKATPKPQPEQPAESANGDAGINSPKALLAAVNDETGGYYNAIPHMLHAIKKHTGDDGYRWPGQADVQGYMDAYKILVEYAEAQRASD
jgi:hypothetical protein